MSGWHALDGNMLAADAHYDGHDGCPFCGGEIKLISGSWSCQDCDWSAQEEDEEQ
jgi:hypothetical protein